MLKRLSVLICGLTVVLLTTDAASGQTATRKAKSTAASTHQTAQVESDADITSAVKTKLLNDKTLGALKIDVDTDHGVVTLSGPVYSSAEKAQAFKLARHTHGVKRVVNKLTIEKKTETTPALDKAAEKTVDAAKTAGKATVDATKTAGKATEKAAEKTGEAVKGTTGEVVKDTESAAKKTGRYLTDAEITSAVKTKLIADSGIHAMDINVDTDHGVVTLKGNVRSKAEKTEALKIAHNTMGVKSVVDKLTVK